jgi:hypothetical protein
MPVGESLYQLYDVARKALEVIDGQVQYHDFEVEFRNELNMLAKAILALEEDEQVKDPGSRNELHKLVKWKMQHKQARPLVWHEWSQLDWKRQDIDDNDERFPCQLATTRFDLSRDLGHDLVGIKV